MKKICITADCTCDLPEDMLKKYNIDLVYYYIVTSSGRFRDLDEITASNIFEYLGENGGKTDTKPPMPFEFREFFSRKLEEYEEVIHITISSKISSGVDHAEEAVRQLGEDGKRVHVFDSLHLSTGMGHLALAAAKMAEEGKTAEEIVACISEMRQRVSTSFIAMSANQLYNNGLVSKTVNNICNFFSIHPVLHMKDGNLKLKSIQIGNYERCIIRYVRNSLKSSERIKKDLLFITHAGCLIKDIRLVQREINRLASFDSVLVSKASATISGNSGPRTVGLLYVNEK